MTPAEQETVQQAYDSIKSSLDEAFPPDSPEGERIQDFLSEIGQKIESNVDGSVKDFSQNGLQTLV